MQGGAVVDLKQVQSVHPFLDAARREQPYDIHRLVTLANAALASVGEEPIGRRTVRYYADEGLLPPPEGPPRLARYGYEHLLRILAARLFQREGLTLEEIKARIDALAPAPATAKEKRLRWLGAHWSYEKPFHRAYERPSRLELEVDRMLRRLGAAAFLPDEFGEHLSDSAAQSAPLNLPTEAIEETKEGNLRFPVSAGVYLEVDPSKERVARHLVHFLRRYLDRVGD